MAEQLIRVLIEIVPEKHDEACQQLAEFYSIVFSRFTINNQLYIFVSMPEDVFDMLPVVPPNWFLGFKTSNQLVAQLEAYKKIKDNRIIYTLDNQISFTTLTKTM